jgi:sulfite exporter TauE/SafE
MLGTLSVAHVDVAVFVLVGLLGGAHCIGMCGPLVPLYASRMRPATDGGGTATATSGLHIAANSSRPLLN